jgi:outer membrane protein assembly factor BamB
MSLTRPLAVMAVLLAGASLGGCGTIGKLNPFDKPKNKVIATQGERIPLAAFNTKVEVAEALKGQPIVLPAMQLVDSWPQPGGPEQGWVDNVAAAQNFQIAWRRDLGQGSSKKFHITATPVVADGKVFAMDGEAMVSALDANTGAPVWRTEVAVHTRRDKEAFGGGVTYANGKIYVSSGYRFIAALDAASGRLLWRTPTDAPIHDAPSVGSGHVIAIDVNDQMVSVDAETGAPDWTYQALTEPARLIKASSPVISGDTVIGAFASGELVSLRASNGNPLWTQVLSRSSRTNALSEIRDIAGRPVVRQGEVFAGSHSGVFMAIDLLTGQPKWGIPVTTLSTPWPAGDVVYIVSKAGEVIAAARASGQVYWIRDLNAGITKRKKRSLFYGPVLASNRLIVTSSKGAAIALDPKTGATLSQIDLGGPGLVAPIAANGLVYVVTADGDLVAIR